MPKNLSSFVSVVIPTRNSERYLSQVLASVSKQQYKNFEVIVVDCSSEDATIKIAERHKAKIVRFPKRGDHRSAQKNLGAKVSQGDMVLFLDSDAQLTPKVLTECLALVKKGNSMIIIPEKHVGTGFWAKAKSLERQCYLGDDTVECPWFFKTKDFLRVGGYDEELISGEDWDLFKRMRKLGMRYTRNKSFIQHNLGHLKFFSYVNKKRYYGKNIKSYISKNKASFIRKIPFIRPAYLRNWRLLVRNPVLTLGFLTLKLFESIFFLIGMMESK